MDVTAYQKKIDECNIKFPHKDYEVSIFWNGRWGELRVFNNAKNVDVTSKIFGKVCDVAATLQNIAVAINGINKIEKRRR